MCSMGPKNKYMQWKQFTQQAMVSLRESCVKSSPCDFLGVSANTCTSCHCHVLYHLFGHHLCGQKQTMWPQVNMVDPVGLIANKRILSFFPFSTLVDFLQLQVIIRCHLERNVTWLVMVMWLFSLLDILLWFEWGETWTGQWETVRDTLASMRLCSNSWSDISHNLIAKVTFIKSANNFVQGKLTLRMVVFPVYAKNKELSNQSAMPWMTWLIFHCTESMHQKQQYISSYFMWCLSGIFRILSYST